MREKLNKLLKKTLYNELLVMESLFFIGTVLIVFTTFLLNFYIGMYLLGLILIGYSVFLFKFREKGGGKK